MKFFDIIKELTRILTKDDIQKYDSSDLEGLILVSTTGNLLEVKDTIVKTINNVLGLPNIIFWDKLERFLHGSYANYEDQIKMASKFEYDTDEYAQFVKRQISIINQIEDDEKVDFFAMLTRAYLLECITTQELYFKLAKFLMLCTYDELKFLQKCDYNFAAPNSAMISGLYQFGLVSQSSDANGNARYVLSDFAKALKQNSLNFHQELHGTDRIRAYSEIQPLAIPEPLSADAIDRIVDGTEIILDGGNASGQGSTIKHGISLPAAQRIADIKVERKEKQIEDKLAQI